VELCHVERLNLLQLAPGGHIGRFIVWTQGAFERLDDIWGSTTRSSTVKKNYTLPFPIMIQSDLTRLINSDEIQSKVRPVKKSNRRSRLKKNPLKNLGVMVHLNPYALALRRSSLLAQQSRVKARAEALQARREHKAPTLSRDEKTQLVADRKHNKVQNANWVRLSREGEPEKKIEISQFKEREARQLAEIKASQVGLGPAVTAAVKKEVKKEAPKKAEPAKDAGKEKKDGGKKEAGKDGGKKEGKEGGKKEGGKEGGKKEGGKEGGKKEGGKKEGGKKEGGKGKKE